eukprot:12474975-Alexandrium_andersonii.AAC.1
MCIRDSSSSEPHIPAVGRVGYLEGENQERATDNYERFWRTGFGLAAPYDNLAPPMVPGPDG